ncbi:hypothetical protein FHR19_003086 [Sphingomonas yantingensis]|uniref:Uncharacterized protein n=1 Tax=Sphingomonas yantingensis TaxID=1241761 RepID=A0A7W9EK68_9SPHN|nr:hypothetical protein [Sphingomonas yantingensis]
MTPRLLIAYALILTMTALAAGFGAYLMYHSHGRSYRRRLRKEQRAYEAREVPRDP